MVDSFRLLQQMNYIFTHRLTKHQPTCLSEANMAVRVSIMVMAMASRSAIDCGGTKRASQLTVK